jgi:DNA segregation ATPase ftsK/spoIIIE
MALPTNGDDALARFNARNQEPEFAPGMGDDSVWGMDSGPSSAPALDPFGSSSRSSSFDSPFGGGSNDPFGSSRSGFGSSSSSPFGGPSSDPFSPSFGQQGPPPASFGQQGQQPQTASEAISQAAQQAASKAGRNSYEFTKAAVVAAKSHTAASVSGMGATTMKTSGVISVAGAGMWLLSNFLPALTVGYYILVGAAVSALVGIATFAGGYLIDQKDDVREQLRRPAPDPDPEPVADPQPLPVFDEPEPASTPAPEPEPEADGWDWNDLIPDEEPVEDVDYDSLESDLENLDMKKGTQTRQFIYETLTKGLPSISPKFADMRNIREGSAEWAIWAELIRDAAKQVGTREDLLPDLKDASENPFMFKLTISRTPRMKTQAIADEVANIYKYDDNGNLEYPNAYATSAESGSRAFTSIYKGTKIDMISLADMYASSTDAQKFVRDPKNEMPVVIGTTGDGKVEYVDLLKAPAIVVSGEPRSGKSWIVKLILNQMCAYMSPNDLHLYIGDPKNQISEYANYNLPHVRRKEYTVDSVIDMLRYLVNTEAPRRKNIMRQYGYVNVLEFRRDHPEVAFPFLYVVLDEMMSLANAMGKEDAREYRELIERFVSEFPALGMRAIFIPHRVKNDVIPKSVSELISVRITAKSASDASAAENLGLNSASEFPYKLSNAGDVAVRIADINDGVPTYLRAAVLAPDTKGMERLESYIGRYWDKLDPARPAEEPAAPATPPAADRWQRHAAPFGRPEEPAPALAPTSAPEPAPAPRKTGGKRRRSSAALFSRVKDRNTMDETREEGGPSIRGAFRDKAPEETADVVDTILEKPAVVEAHDTPEPDTRDERTGDKWEVVEEPPALTPEEPALTPEESTNLDNESFWDTL